MTTFMIYVYACQSGTSLDMDVAHINSVVSLNYAVSLNEGGRGGGGGGGRQSVVLEMANSVIRLAISDISV